MKQWQEEDKAELRRLWGDGWGRTRLADHFGVTPNAIRGQETRLNLHTHAKPGKVRGLRANHPAVVEGRTLFPSTVRGLPIWKRRRPTGPDQGRHVLVTGRSQRKLGDIVSKGAWKGSPIFSLTLEERATCPRACAHWGTCYGSSMPFSRRRRHGRVLEDRIEWELAELQAMFPEGFVIRLHLLGDFYSVGYVRRWERWLGLFPALRVFGYSARGPQTKIGAEIGRLSKDQWHRFAVRSSVAEPAPASAVTIWTPAAENAVEGIICPVMTGKSESCASCTLCWAPAARDKTILFIAHGR